MVLFMITFFSTCLDLPNCMAPVPSTNILTQCPYNTNIVTLQRKKETIETSNSFIISLIRILTQLLQKNYEKHGGNVPFTSNHSIQLPSKCHIQCSGWNKNG